MNFEKISKYEVYFLVFLLIAGLILRIYISNCYYWDELVYLQHADIFSGKINNYNEFDIRAPMFPMIISAVYILWHNPLMVNIFTTLISALSIPLIYFLGKEMFNKKIGLIAALLLAFWPLHIFLSKQILVHNTALFFGILFLLFLKKGQNTGKSWMFFLSGLFLGLGILTRFTYAFLFLVLALDFILFFKKYSFKKVILFGLGLVLVLAPYFIWAGITYGDFFYTITYGSMIAMLSKTPRWFYFSNMHILLGLAGIIGLLLWIFFKFKDKRISKNESVMLAWILIPVVCLTLMAHKEIRYLTMTLLAIVILSSIGFLRLYESIKNKKLAAMLIILTVLAGILFFSYNPYPRECNSDGKFVSEWIMNNTLENDTVYVQDYYPYLGYYTDRRIILAPLNRDRFLDMNNPFFRNNGEGYLVYFEAQNQSNLEKLLDLENDTRFSLLQEIKNQETVYIFKVNKL